MQKAGDILVIGERRQLVFHVVPHPSRLGYFTDVYAAAMAAAADSSGGVRATAVNRTLTPLTRPVVSTEVIAVSPTDDFAAEWWSVADAHSDVSVQVSAAAAMRMVPTLEVDRASFINRFAAFVGGMFHGARRFLAFAS
jgi:hypothetical protein